MFIVAYLLYALHRVKWPDREAYHLSQRRISEFVGLYLRVSSVFRGITLRHMYLKCVILTLHKAFRINVIALLLIWDL
jgi:hypothetical protein